MATKKNYLVYFDIFGKKLRTKVLAESEEEAKRIIKEKIVFHKIVKDGSDDFNKATDLLDDFINILKK